MDPVRCRCCEEGLDGVLLVGRLGVVDTPLRPVAVAAVVELAEVDPACLGLLAFARLPSLPRRVVDARRAAVTTSRLADPAEPARRAAVTTSRLADPAEPARRVAAHRT